MIRNKLTILILCIVCLLSIVMSGYTAAPPEVDFDEVEIIPVYKSGIRVSDGLIINGTTYTQLRAFSDAVGEELEIAWDSETKTATIEADELSLSATVGNHYLEANGRYMYIPDSVMCYEGSVIVPIRVIAKVFNVDILWDDLTYSVSLDAENISYIESGEDFYDEDDLYWLSRLIYSESGNQDFDGQIGVGNVVLNRLSDPTCPDTVYDVIFDNKYGVQFSVTTNGTIFKDPDAESVIAAKICLEGYNNVEDAIYFVNPEIGVSSWFTKTRSFVASIGEHDFYA